MRKIVLIVGLILGVFSLYSQTCEDLYNEYNRLNNQYKKCYTIAGKKKCIEQMKTVLKYAKDLNCGYQQFEIDVKKLEENLKRQEEASLSKPVFNQDTCTFGATAQNIRIEGVFSDKVKLLSYPEWMEFIEVDGKKALVFSMQENLSVYGRSDTIVVEERNKRHECVVSQEAAPFWADVTERLKFGQDEGRSFVFIYSNDTAWTFSEDADWLLFERDENRIEVECEKNPEKRKRSATITIQFACGETRVVNVEQAIGRTTLSVPVEEFTFDHYSGTEYNVVVKCNYDKWSATSEASWIHPEKKQGGISIAYDANLIAKSRVSYVKIETNDEEHLVKYIKITQEEAPAYLHVGQNTSGQSAYLRDGYEETIAISVTTNIPESEWKCTLKKDNGWVTIKSKSQEKIVLHLKRNDLNSSRTAEILLSGKGKEYRIIITQPNRGYKGRCRDYFDANGAWRLTYMSFDFHGMTTIGDNISLFNFRWKPLEFSLLNLNLDYMMEGGFSASLEPVVRGFLPISRNGKLAAFVGVGAHVNLTGGYHYPLCETGLEVQWSNKCSSRIFFKYNGACSLGMSIDLGRWF